MPPALYEGLVEADRLDQRSEWGRAQELLDDLDRRYPGRPEVLSALVNVYYELGDLRSYQFACQRLVPLRPDDPDVRLMLAGSCLANACPALALHSFRLFIERWPDDVRVQDVRKTADDLDTNMCGLLKDLGLAGEEGLRLAALHEEALCWLEQGEYGQARAVAEQLLERRADFLPAINNLGEAHFREGQAEQAIAAAERVLEIAPENFHALANLTRYLCMSGRALEAQPWAEQLKSVQSEDPDLWIKKAEALSYLGDDEGILETFDGAGRSGNLGTPRHEALLHHLAAVAALRLGHEKKAHRYWKRALKLFPKLDMAKDNLEDFKKPVGQRHAPWAYDLKHWIPENLVRKLASRLERAERQGKDASVVRATRRYLEGHPQVTALLPTLLERGDPVGREFALRIAMLAGTPESLEALQDFAFSERGPDELRQRAAETLREAGMMPGGPARMWIKGQWQEILLFGFEIHDEPNQTHQPQVEQWAYEAMVALRNDDGQKAERLLKQALEVEPDAPDLLNNLATAYQLQGRVDDWRRLIHQVHDRYPDYLFGRINMAIEHVRTGQIEQAKEMLRPLLSRERFHCSEFAYLCVAQIELSLAEGNVDAARSWLGMWEDIDPDHPGLEQYRPRLALGGRLQRPFRRLISGVGRIQ